MLGKKILLGFVYEYTFVNGCLVEQNKYTTFNEDSEYTPFVPEFVGGGFFFIRLSRKNTDATEKVLFVDDLSTISVDEVDDFDYFAEVIGFTPKEHSEVYNMDNGDIVKMRSEAVVFLCRILAVNNKTTFQG